MGKEVDMPKSEGTVNINAPIEKVFDAIADPKVIDRESAGKLVEAKGNNGEIGSYAVWEYMKLRSTTTVTEVEKPYKLIQEMAGGMPGRWIWNLKQDGETVKIEFFIEYKVPGGIFGTLMDKLFLHGVNEKNGEKTLQGIKAYCESRN